MINKKAKGYFKVTLLTLFTVGLCNISLANHHEDTTMNSDKNKVANTVQVMTEAFHKKDMNSIMASYEKGAAIMFEPGTAISDPDTIKKMFEGAFQINPEFTYPKGHEVYIANDIAMHIAPWVMTGKTPDGTDIEQTGLSVAILRKQVNGEWLMVLDNPNSQVLMNQ
jgi:ketosteroid isomerase-like protein